MWGGEGCRRSPGLCPAPSPAGVPRAPPSLRGGRTQSLMQVLSPRIWEDCCSSLSPISCVPTATRCQEQGPGVHTPLRVSACQAGKGRQSPGWRQNLVWVRMTLERMEGLGERRPSPGGLGRALNDRPPLWQCLMKRRSSLV